jgi:hypothetical protein
MNLFALPLCFILLFLLFNLPRVRPPPSHIFHLQANWISDDAVSRLKSLFTNWPRIGALNSSPPDDARRKTRK